jgi:hypothetical protein
MPDSATSLSAPGWLTPGIVSSPLTAPATVSGAWGGGAVSDDVKMALAQMALR